MTRYGISEDYYNILYKKQDGKPEYLIFCQNVNNLNEILINMILEIKEKIT